MKKFFYICLIGILFSFNSYSQNLNWVAFDTNGPMGECLFPQNEDGEIIYTKIITSTLSVDTIFGLAKEFIYDIGKKYKADCTVELVGISKVACKVKLPIGKEYFSVGVWSSDNIGTWERAHSEISFDLVIDIRPGKYRYLLNNFYTQRRRIPGEGKDDGPSNLIHWQRVNSLTKEMPNKGKKRFEYKQMIDDENATYEAEYNAVQKVIEGIESFATIDDF